MKKSDKEFKIYINYKIFNVFIILNRNAPLLIKKTLFKFYIIKIYSKFDFIIIFNEIKIKKDYKEKITFLIKYRFYGYLIILFKLYNILTTF